MGEGPEGAADEVIIGVLAAALADAMTMTGRCCTTELKTRWRAAYSARCIFCMRCRVELELHARAKSKCLNWIRNILQL
jgi:hypothetical protein